MPISSPLAWQNPNSAGIDAAAGGPLSATVFDNIASDLFILGGSDGASGLVRPYNMLINGGFEVWQRGTGPFSANVTTADRWYCAVAGGGTSATISQETGVIDVPSTAALKVALTWATGGACNVQQRLEDYRQLVGRVMTFSCRVNTSVAGVTAQILDSAGASSGTANVTTGGYETISVTRALAAGITSVSVAIILPNASCTVYLDNAVLVMGSVVGPYAPLRPADEFNACQRYYQRLGDPASGRVMIGGGYLTAGLASFTTLWFRVPMAAAPTLTLVGTWGLVNCTAQPTIAWGDTTCCYGSVTATASGICYATNSGASCTITAEVATP